MAGIFGFFDYSKPGKGVDPDAPVKRAPFRYFELLWRNLSRFMVLNLVYFVCMLPLLMLFHLAFFDPLFEYTLDVDGFALSASPLFQLFIFVFSWPRWILAALAMISATIQGPLTCGLSYCLRNAVREEHYWRSDMWARSISNLRQGLALSVFDAVMFGAGLFNVSLISESFDSLTGFMQAVVFVSVFVLLLYLAMRSTIYVMAVTFELTLPQLIRNAFILSIVGLPRHILSGFIYALILVPVMFYGIAELVVLPIIGFVLLGYTSVFVNYPLIDKHLIQPLLMREAGLTADTEESEN